MKQKKVFIQILVVAAVIVVGLWWVLPKSRVLQESDCFQFEKLEEKTKEVVLLLDKGDYQGLRELSVEKFAPMINEEQMEAARKNLSDNWGALKNYDFQNFTESVQRGQHSAIVNVKITYENTEVEYGISFNEAMKLNGLQMGKPQ